MSDKMTPLEKEWDGMMNRLTPEEQDIVNANFDSYERNIHAMQAGVAIEMSDPSINATTPKHLRVGINSALMETAILARLLLRKGIISVVEYSAALAEGAEQEKLTYERRISAKKGIKVNLA